MADSHVISLQAAGSMTAAWRNLSTYSNSENRIAVAFAREAIERVLFQNENLAGLRFYFALDSKQQITLVICGYDGQGNDLTRELADNGNPCPSICADANGLNS